MRTENKNKRRKLTQEQKATYLRKRSVRHDPSCPYCGSDRLISRDPQERDAAIVQRLITCIDCARKWYDLYKIAFVEEE